MTDPSKSLVLVCSDCEEEFVFTARAREYFQLRGRNEPPGRCKHCHIEAKKRERLADFSRTRLFDDPAV